MLYYAVPHSVSTQKALLPSIIVSIGIYSLNKPVCTQLKRFTMNTFKASLQSHFWMICLFLVCHLKSNSLMPLCLILLALLLLSFAVCPFNPLSTQCVHLMEWCSISCEYEGLLLFSLLPTLCPSLHAHRPWEEMATENVFSMCYSILCAVLYDDSQYNSYLMHWCNMQ